MERIVIEVDEATARKWESVSPQIKNQLQKKIEKQIESALNDLKEQNLDSWLGKARQEAAKNGLTEEILQQLLNEK